jgi:hypothetical protein
VRLKGLINLRNFGVVKFPVARTPRAKKWSKKNRKIAILSQKRVQPAICPKALHRGSETSLQHTNAVQAPFMIECHSHKKSKNFKIGDFRPKMVIKHFCRFFWKLFKIDFQLIFDRAQNRRKMSYRGVRGCKMGLLGPQKPQIFFPGRFRPNQPILMILYLADSAGKYYFWILWTQETHFAPSNTSITHFATILRSIENQSKIDFEEFPKKRQKFLITILGRKSPILKFLVFFYGNGIRS